MGRYTAAHENPQGADDARPTALQIIQDEDLVSKLRGKVIVITGTSSGIGVETARALYATGASLFLTARDITKAKGVLADILDDAEKRAILVEMDNACLDSVRAAASAILSQSKNQVNILINNAGIMATPTLTLTPEGNELQFQTNHLAHFLLFQLLKPALLASSTPALHSRVVNVSSSGHRVFVFNDNPDYAFQHTPYESWTAYGQSKLANIYMTNYIDRAYGAQGLRATSVHPGGIISGLMKDMDPQLVAGFMADEAKMRSLKSWGQGAATTIIAAVGKEWEDRGGKYLVDCEETVMERGIAGEKEGFVSQTYDEDKEARLWKDSLKLVGLDSGL